MAEPVETTLVLAVADVAGFARACRAQSDLDTFRMLDRFYRRAADVIAPAQGRLVKPMGDMVLMTFPEARAGQAVAALWELKAAVQDLWSGFGQECRIRVHAHIGPVAAGPLGPERRFDVVGKSVNDLFLMPWDGPELSAALAQRLGGEDLPQGRPDR